MWNDLVTIGFPVVEKIIRTVAVYAVIALLLRFAGRRDLAQFTTLDLIVILLLSNVVQNAIIGPDNSILGGAIGAVTLLAVNAVVVRISTSSDRAERVMQGESVPIIRGGEYVEGELRRLGLRHRDVTAALRAQGAMGPGDVLRADLLPSGTLEVQLMEDAQPATRADIDRLVARLDELSGKLNR